MPEIRKNLLLHRGGRSLPAFLIVFGVLGLRRRDGARTTRADLSTMTHCRRRHS